MSESFRRHPNSSQQNIMQNAVPFVVSVPALEFASQIGNPEGSPAYQISPAANFAVGVTLLHILLVHDILAGNFLPIDFPLSHQLFNVVLLLPEDVL